MKVLVCSLYELGHQPLSALSLATLLRQAGHEAEILDLDRAQNDKLSGALDGRDALIVSVPMHTASAIALGLIKNAFEGRPDLPVALWGLYATNLAQAPLPPNVGLLASGETASDVLEWLEGLQDSALLDPAHPHVVSRAREAGRLPTITPDRSELPALCNYAKLSINGTERLTGYTEATRGCMHTCSHCPVPTVYGGRIRINRPDWVLADIDQLVKLGAEHITFGDPDFFNAPAHAMRILKSMHSAHEELSFDATIKVEHLLEHKDLLPTLAESGCAFVVSAFEHVSDQVLAHLRKGHTAAQMVQAVKACRELGIELRPSLLPFTPWTQPSDIIELFEFIQDQDLVANVDPIQLTIRLLVPAGSLLLREPGADDTYRPSQGEPLSYVWSSPWPELDDLQSELSEHLPGWLEKFEAWEIFDRMYKLACTRLGYQSREFDYGPGLSRGVPRLTESWFCCAEPSETMVIAPVRLSDRQMVD